jgi:ectoine hydroxylase-related dioxygenase (phytanoyl-CoA dioxygenase family)
MVGPQRIVEEACDRLLKQGYALLDHVLPADKARTLHREFNSRYARYMRDVEYEETLKVGDRRFRVPVELSGGFADPDVYANTAVLAVVRRMLGEDAILEAFGAVVSLSGADAQHVHRDSPLLFDAAIAPLLPCHAVTVALPLVDMDEVQGTTALWPGSHRWKTRSTEAAPDILAIPAGSCLLWDYRLYHGGTANRSAQARPMLYATYARSWYRDPTGFTRPGLARLALQPDFVRSLPPDRRGLFSHLS